MKNDILDYLKVVFVPGVSLFMGGSVLMIFVFLFTGNPFDAEWGTKVFLLGLLLISVSLLTSVVEAIQKRYTAIRERYIRRKSQKMQGASRKERKWAFVGLLLVVISLVLVPLYLFQ